jgi:hypothetical protein
LNASHDNSRLKTTGSWLVVVGLMCRLLRRE